VDSAGRGSVFSGAAAGYVQLLDGGHRGPGQVADLVGPHGNLAPAEDDEALLASDGLDGALDDAARGRVRRQEDVADGVAAGVGELERGNGTEELVGDLGDDAGTVAGSRVGADGTTVFEVAQSVKGPRDDVVSGRPTQGGDHGETAGVSFVMRVVETLFRGNTTEPREEWLLGHENVLTR
jgi:hypothetical protein